MYRILSASQDTYLTNKYISGSPSIEANVGQAGTLDLFKLHNETSILDASGSIIPITELSRLLIKFDYSTLQELTSSFLDISDASFKCFLELKNVYGGQTTPSNFDVSLFPLAKSWDEGRGMDVIAYRDLDSANFLTASILNGNSTTWTVSGAAGTGSLGESTDIFVIGDLGAGSQSLEASQHFERGDEDLYLDVTNIVSASMAGQFMNHGFRISLVSDLETDSTTYFVKRFGSRHTLDKSLQPRLLVKYDNQLKDSIHDAEFDLSQSFFTYNMANGEYRNLYSGSNEITGTDSLIMELAASRSIQFITSSFSVSHNQDISHLSKSMSYFTTYYTGSQFTSGDIPQTGIYSTDFELPTNQELTNFLSGSNSYEFKVSWKSLDLTKTYASTYTTFKSLQGGNYNSQRRNWVVNITNLQTKYSNKNNVRLRVFVQDYDTEQIATKIPKETLSTIVYDMRWRLRGAYDKKVLIPFDESTKLSFDGLGMYFDLYVSDLDINEVYQIDFEVKSETGKSTYIENSGFRFKVIS